MGTIDARDHVYRHALAAAMRYGREALARGVPKDVATFGAVSLACHLMIGAGLSVRETADRIGLSTAVVVALADANEDARIESPAIGRWLGSIEARMPRVDGDGDTHHDAAVLS